MPSERVTGGKEKGCMRNNWKTYFFSPIPKDGQVVAALPSILGTPSLWWTGQFMAKGRSHGGQTEVKRRLYPWFRHSLS